MGLASSVEGVSRLIDAIGTAIRLEPALFDLAVCAEMVFLDLPFEQRVRRIAESGFQVEIWNWTYHDIDALVQTGARFSSMAELGERAGVTFCLENLNTVIDHPGAPFARPQDTLALVEAVNRPGLRMMLDLYHAQIGEGNLIALLRRADSLIGEVQVADVPGRCEPGTGEINYSAIAMALKEMGYRGTVGLEAYASGEDKVALERFSSVFGAGATTAIGRQED